MSSNILHDIDNQLYMQRDKRFVVRTGREALAEYVREEIDRRGWSYGEIVRRSKRHIKSASTLVNMVNGHVKTVSEDTLRGIAHAFEVPPETVFEIYYEKGKKENGFKDSDFARLYFKHNKLTKARQKEFERIWQMVERDYDRALLDENKEAK
jgi:transcriptional regulator with XRE-family HTH domain